ncbi:MAG: tRNA lysidine(34) synthetase TilS [Ruminococcus sp.]|nr:tRNA lysidine(34) synthetase TilS [Ruminococcus sp.]
MLDKIQRFAEKYNMFPKGSAVVCGLSGGADSVCLLVCLSELSSSLGITVEALHVNHCLRGAESDHDEEFCRDLCERLGISFTSVSCDVRGYAELHSLSLEEAARKLRYNAFSQHSVEKLVATAHNANDNLETVMLNLARGTALKGLAGIPPVRGNIVRPLLTVSRKEIEQFLHERSIGYVTDSTNLSDDYTRNKIRHRILPLFEDINSSVVETSITSIDAVRAENSFIEQEASEAYKLCCVGNSLSGLSGYHEVIRRRCIARLLSENKLPYSYDRLSDADRILLSGGKINLAGELYLVSDGKTLRLERIAPKQQEILLSEQLKIGENSIFSDKKVYTELIKAENLQKSLNINKKLAIYYLDYDKIKGRAFLRNRRFGDKIKLSGRSFTSSVKKLINEKIPPELRDELHFIEDEYGTIFAEMLGIADRVAPDENTVNYLKITVTDN